MLTKLKDWARKLKKQIFTLYFASRDNRVPWYAKVFIAMIVAYAFSPIDLIPDFIPILGYLDDVILLPIGIMLALKMIPKPVLADCTVKVEEMLNKAKPKNWVAGTIIIGIWSVIIIWAILEIYHYIN